MSLDILCNDKTSLILLASTSKNLERNPVRHRRPYE